MDSKEELENLKHEFEQTKYQKKETEVQIGNFLKNAAKRGTELLLVKRELEKQKIDLENKNADLSAERGRIESDCDKKSKELWGKETQLEKKSKELQDREAQLEEKSKELQDKEAQLVETGKRLDVINLEQKRMLKKRGFVFKAVLSVLAAAMLFGWIYFNGEISELEMSKKEAFAELLEKEEEISRLETKSLAQLSDLMDKEKYISELEAREVLVKINNVYNGGENGKKIGDLKASEMRYLTFDYNVYFLGDKVEWAIIYVDIYNPDGSLNSGTHSPNGHSYFDVILASGNTWLGYGNSERSVYRSGTYRVDFIYKDVIIHSQKVVISD